jgi:uncharacterized membrane protein YccF (DUF307 family)
MLRLILNILWLLLGGLVLALGWLLAALVMFILAGWWLAIRHLVAAVALAITIVGIPLAAAHIKLIPISLVPFGREVAPIDEVEAGAGVAVPR